MVNVGKLGPLYVGQNRSYTVGKNGTASAAHQAEAFQAMADILEAARSHIRLQTDSLGQASDRLYKFANLGPSWGIDVDPDPQRIVKTLPRVPSERLDRGLVTLGMVLELDEKGQPNRLALESDQGNYKTEAVWKNGRLSLLEDFRRLADGSEESFHVKAQRGGGYRVKAEYLPAQES